MPTGADIHLPSCLTKADVYCIAVDDLSQGGLECCKRSAFYDILEFRVPSCEDPEGMYIRNYP